MASARDQHLGIALCSTHEVVFCIPRHQTRSDVEVAPERECRVDIVACLLNHAPNFEIALCSTHKAFSYIPVRRTRLDGLAALELHFD